MSARILRSAVVGLIASSCAAFGSACYVAEEPPPAYAYGYEPQYYDGYVVYYDDAGRPFYYVDGSVVWVPPSSPLYIGFVNHWRVHGPAYHHWYSHYGYGYRGYRHRR